MSVERKGSYSEGGEKVGDDRETYVSCYNPTTKIDLVVLLSVLPEKPIGYIYSHRMSSCQHVFCHTARRAPPSTDPRTL